MDAKMKAVDVETAPVGMSLPGVSPKRVWSCDEKGGEDERYLVFCANEP